MSSQVVDVKIEKLLSHSSSGKSVQPKKAQNGVVLFIAMVALVVMSLAGVALIRSVDTNSQIAGNLSFRQTSITSASYGIETMTEKLAADAQSNGYINNKMADNGYYATCRNFDLAGATVCSGGKLTQEAFWTASSSRKADGLDISGGKDAYGNNISYIVERMCDKTGPTEKESCLMRLSDADRDSHNVEDIPGVNPYESLSELPIFRVTVRVVGPKNTVSYIQAFIS
jgi:Tfp pilus assembly protein PilX